MSDTIKNINKITESIIKMIDAVYKEVLKISPNNQTYHNTLRKIGLLYNEIHEPLNRITFMQYSHIDSAVRNASKKADIKIENFITNIETKLDIFKILLNIKKKTENGEIKLNYIEKKYLDKSLLDSKRNGLYLEKKMRNELKKIHKRLILLGSKFLANIVNDDTKAYFTKDELKGVSDQFLESLDTIHGDKILDTKIEDRDNTYYIIHMKSPYINPIMKNAVYEETRKKLYTIQRSRCLQNIDILLEAIQLRKKFANILKYDTFSKFMLEKRMAGNQENVNMFLNDLLNLLKPIRNKEIKTMELLKKGELYPWDIKFYEELIMKKKFNIDTENVKEYFPLEHIIKCMFKKYQTIFNIIIVETDITEDDYEMFGHKKISKFVVKSCETKSLMGYFIIDLFPHKGKYNHYACFPIANRIIDKDGNTIIPANCVLLGNFTEPTKKKPSLLKHDEIETLFHEFGHVIHNILGAAEYSLFSGSKVEWDFLEMPSQLLENLCWEKDYLKELSNHWKTGKKLQDKIIDSMISARYLNVGLKNCRQIFYATFDQIIHGDITNISNNKKLFNIYNTMSTEILGISNDTHLTDISTFNHIMSGYSASYYSYLWSEVYADDIYSVLKENPHKWDDYCKKILLLGATMNAHDMMYNFLNREPNNKAFLKNITNNVI